MKTQHWLTSLTLISMFIFFPVALSEAASNNALDKQGLSLIGKADFSVLFWRVYKSRLYSPDGKFAGITPEILFEITYQRDISQKELIDNTIEQWQKMGVTSEEFNHYIPQLKHIWPSVTEGDSLALKVNDRSSDFYFNNQLIGSIIDEEFAELFLGIWLSAKTTRPDFRQKLLGAPK